MSRSATLNVSLTPRQRQFVDARVSSGQYESASEVIREALRLLEQEDAARKAYWSEVRAKVAEAREDVKRGRTLDGEQFMRDLVSRTSKRQGRAAK